MMWQKESIIILVDYFNQKVTDIQHTSPTTSKKKRAPKKTATYPFGKYKPTFRAVCVPEVTHRDA